MSACPGCSCRCAALPQVCFPPFLSPSLAVTAKARTAAIVEVSALLAFAGSETGTSGATGAECHATGCRSCTQPSAEPNENQQFWFANTPLKRLAWAGSTVLRHSMPTACSAFSCGSPRRFIRGSDSGWSKSGPSGVINSAAGRASAVTIPYPM